MASVVSFLPKVQEHNPTSGILQSSFVSFYVMYMTWSAMSNNSNRACNPGLLGILNPKDVYTTTTPSTPSNSTTPIVPYQATHVLDAPSILSLILWFLVILYSSFSSASKGDKLINVGNGKERTSLTDGERECFLLCIEFKKKFSFRLCFLHGHVSCFCFFFNITIININISVANI